MNGRSHPCDVLKPYVHDDAFNARVLEIFSVDNPALVDDAHELQMTPYSTKEIPQRLRSV